MSSSTTGQNVRSASGHHNTVSRVYLEDLKKLTVKICRHNITDPVVTASKKIERNLDNPSELRVHFRPVWNIAPSRTTSSTKYLIQLFRSRNIVIDCKNEFFLSKKNQASSSFIRTTEDWITFSKQQNNNYNLQLNFGKQQTFRVRTSFLSENEGLRPIFDRHDIEVNNEECDEKFVFIKEQHNTKKQHRNRSLSNKSRSSRSHNSSSSSSNSTDSSRHSNSRHKKNTTQNIHNRDYTKRDYSNNDSNRNLREQRHSVSYAKSNVLPTGSSRSPSRRYHHDNRGRSRSPIVNVRKKSLPPSIAIEGGGNSSRSQRQKQQRRDHISRSPPPASSPYRTERRFSRSPPPQSSFGTTSQRSGKELIEHRRRGDSRSPKYSRRNRTPPSSLRSRRNRKSPPPSPPSGARRRTSPSRLSPARHPRRGRSRSRSVDDERRRRRHSTMYNRRRSSKSPRSSYRSGGGGKMAAETMAQIPPPPPMHISADYASFYEGNEYWIPGPMPPGRFIPRGTYLPPPGTTTGGFPRVGVVPPRHHHPIMMPPRIPMMIPPPHAQLRRPQRLPVYNNRPYRTNYSIMKEAGAATTTTSASSITGDDSTSTAITTAAVSSTAAVAVPTRDSSSNSSSLNNKSSRDNTEEIVGSS